jgi:hypothetical protein
MTLSITHCLAFSATLLLVACQQQTAAPPDGTSASSKGFVTAGSLVPSSVGITECDDYLTKYQACVASKVPEATRAAFKQSLDQTRVAWRRALDTPGGREGLAAACKQAHDASKKSLSAYGCTDF